MSSAGPTEQHTVCHRKHHGRRGAAALLAAALGCITTISTAQPHQEAGFGPPGAPGASGASGAPFVMRALGRCLEAHGLESPREAGQVQTWLCSGEPRQRWRIAALPATAAPPPPPPPPPTAPPPPVVRDVEAGPLFSNAEAARKCPAVCTPARWNGQWVTTVPGRMSVCGCVFDPPAGAPGPATPPAPPAPPPLPPLAIEAMAPESFEALVRQLDDEAFPANALRTLQTVSQDHRFKVEQVRHLFELFAFGRDRLRALEITLPRLTDRTNAYQLIGAFTFESEKAQARQLIERAAASGR